MIKPHQLLIYASYALLWWSMANDVTAQSLAQTEKQFSLRRAEVPIEGDYLDAVFYADSATQELRPKIIIRKEGVDFMTREGSLRNRVVTKNGYFSPRSANGKYIVLFERGLQLYNDAGELMWQKFLEESDEDGAGQEFMVSSLGILCNLNRDDGTVSFYDQRGAIIANHVVTTDLARTLIGKYSNDGRYFVATAPGRRIAQNYQLILFDSVGRPIWTRELEKKWILDIVFSTRAGLLAVKYRDFVTRATNAAIFSFQGELLTTLTDDMIGDAVFTKDDRWLAVNVLSKSNPQTSKLLLYEVPAGRKVFEVQFSKRIYDLKLDADGIHLYALLGVRTVVPQKLTESQAGKLSPRRSFITQHALATINLKGELLGMNDLSSFELYEGSLCFCPASASNLVCIQAGEKRFYYSLE